MGHPTGQDVVGISFARHADPESISFNNGDVGIEGVLNAPILVMDTYTVNPFSAVAIGYFDNYWDVDSSFTWSKYEYLPYCIPISIYSDFSLNGNIYILQCLNGLHHLSQNVMYVNCRPSKCDTF